MNYFNNINLNQNELQKAVMHPLAQPPATAKQGQIYFNTVDKKLYYYNDTKWVAVNDIDLSNYATIAQLNNKLDKQTTTDSNTQVYAVTGNTQKMINATSEATKDTVVLRDTNGRLQVADGAVAADAVNKGQMDTAIATAIEAGISGLEHTGNKVTTITGEGSEVQYPSTGAVINYVKGQVSKVKDVTLDGESIVNDQGIVPLESTYYVELTGASGTLTTEEITKLAEDNNSYIKWKATSSGVFFAKLTLSLDIGDELYYETIHDGSMSTNYTSLYLRQIVITKSTGAWTRVTIAGESINNKTTSITSSSTDIQYPSAKAVYNYVQTEIGKIDQFKYKVSTDAASTPEGVIWYSGTTEDTKVTGTLKASGSTEYTIYLVPCKHTAEEDQQGYDEYLTIKNSADKYVWEVLGNTRDLDLSDYVSKTKTEPQAIKSSLQLGSDTQNCAFISETGSYKLIKKGVITEYNADNIKHGSYELTLPSKTGTIALLSDIPTSPTNMVTTDGNQDITGVKTFKANVILNSTLQAGTSVGTAGQVLTSRGAGNAPQWTTLNIPTDSDYLTSTPAEQVISNGVNKKLGGSSDFKIQLVDTSSFKVTDSTNSDNLLFSVVRGLDSMASPNRVYINAPLAIGSSSTAVGTAGQVLTSQGDGKAPIWQTVSDVLPDNVVTTDTPQRITGAKTFSATTEFTNAIKVSGVVGTAGQVMVSQGADKSPVWTTLTIPQGTVKKFVQTFTGDGTKTMFNYTHGFDSGDCTVTLYKKVGSTEYEVVIADITVSVSSIYIQFAQAPTTSDSFKVVVTG